MWNVDSPSWWATLQQMWFQSDKVSPRCNSVKMTFSFFPVNILTVWRAGLWAARHTTVCLDLIQNSQAVKKNSAALKKAMVKKDVKSKVAARKWL